MGKYIFTHVYVDIGKSEVVYMYENCAIRILIIYIWIWIWIWIIELQ